jgi:hypothetical protein
MNYGDVADGSPCEVGNAADGGGERKFASPLLAGRHVKLRHITPHDYGVIQMLEFTTDLGLRWRWRGTTPSPEQWTQGLWQGVLAQFLVITATKERPLGLVMVHRANFQDQHAYLGAARFGSDALSPLMMIGLGMFVEYVFTCWAFEKLYLETPEYNYQQFASGQDRFFTVEGRLREHTFYAGKRWDQLILAIYRNDWSRHGVRLLETERVAVPRELRIRVPALPVRDR